jgi:hypothetical protein
MRGNMPCRAGKGLCRPAVDALLHTSTPDPPWYTGLAKARSRLLLCCMVCAVAILLSVVCVLKRRCLALLLTRAEQLSGHLLSTACPEAKVANEAEVLI